MDELIKVKDEHLSACSDSYMNDINTFKGSFGDFEETDSIVQHLSKVVEQINKIRIKLVS